MILVFHSGDKNMNEKRKIDNKVFHFLALIISFFISFFRSFYLLFSKNNNIKKENIFFLTLRYIFSIWPKYFWKKPTLYKIFSFP
jgi:Golgi nucleoside diphosphatase